MDMDITASVYHNDLILETILQFVRYEERVNIELSSWRLYNLSRKTCCRQWRQPSLIVYEKISYIPEPQKKFKFALTEHFGLKVPYNLPINKRYPIREELEGIFKIYSRQFSHQIKDIHFLSIMDLNTLKLIQKCFKYITGLKCDSYDDGCIEYLKSEGQTLSKQIRRLELIVDDVQKSHEIITSFKNLKHFHCISKNNSNEKVFQLLNLLKSNYNLENGRRNQKKLPNLELGLTVFLTPSLTTTLPQLANLTELGITFKLFGHENFVVEFFRAINIHNLKEVSIFDLTLNTEIIDLMAFNGKSKLRFLHLNNYDNISETRSIGDIFPNTLKHLYISGNIYIRDIQIISKRCSHLKNFHFFPLYHSHSLSYAEEVHKMIFCLKNLQVCVIGYDMDPQFLIDLWDYHPSLTKLQCLVIDVNLSALDEIYLKLYGRSRKEPSTIFPKGRFLVNLTLPVESELKKEIDFSKIFGGRKDVLWQAFFRHIHLSLFVLMFIFMWIFIILVVFHKAMTEGFPQSY